MKLALSSLLLFVVLSVASDLAIHPITIDDLEERAVTYPVPGTNVLVPGSYVYNQVDSARVRVFTARAEVTEANLDKGSDTTETTRNWAKYQGLPTDDAGHILANRLGGSGKEPVNIFPQNPTINRGQYRVFEGTIYECIKSSPGITASLTWTFSYAFPNSTRPTGIDYCARFTSSVPPCVNGCRQFSN